MPAEQRSRNDCPVFVADHHTECDGNFDNDCRVFVADHHTECDGYFDEARSVMAALTRRQFLLERG